MLLVADGANVLRPWAGAGRVVAAVEDASGSRIVDVVPDDVAGWRIGETLLAPGGDPSLAARPDGALLLAYTHGGAIHLAESTDGGVSWADTGAPFEPARAWEEGAVRLPSLVVEVDRLLLYYVGGKGAGIGAAERRDGGAAWVHLGPGPVLAPLAVDDATPFETKPLTGASVTRETTPIGRVRYEAFYTAGDAVGFAASFDGVVFSRFQLNPILEVSGFGIADPMRFGDRLLHVRNLVKGAPKKGRVLAAAVFGETPVAVDAVP